MKHLSFKPLWLGYLTIGCSGLYNQVNVCLLLLVVQCLSWVVIFSSSFWSVVSWAEGRVTHHHKTPHMDN